MKIKMNVMLVMVKDGFMRRKMNSILLQLIALNNLVNEKDFITFWIGFFLACAVGAWMGNKIVEEMFKGGD